MLPIQKYWLNSFYGIVYVLELYVVAEEDFVINWKHY